MTALPGPDGRLRCSWALSAPEYVAYHDEEWGRPVRTAAGLYERLTLEAFQSGLAWITILRKRDNFRAAFAGFDPERVAEFGPADVERLMGDVGIVRNLAKIEAAIANAAVVNRMGESFAELIWSYAQPDRPRPVDDSAVPPQTPESVALSKALKREGIRFFGPTTAYAMMQAVGLVNDHLAACETG
ncbi:DNA-3-methyladenine glycosylase I [Microlunatus parietis]|uniref:DNA-3-methyladenine glycosylase I n=1 Tax=Microlunatus parietis TaxID=682979 RepID=A0A7Y9LBX6_9ACTN|nr:DNA-3-methyladenine glycosylase I [Microlunatus parietis]NYE70261.1 DNA-3-methyladenine glycosylase I [Microlunatus parietis]